MEIILADAAGFCFGVKRALDTALDTAEENKGAPICTLGPLIHNPQVVEELESKGIRVQQQPGDIDAGVVIVRCHGIPPKDYQLLSSRSLTVVDATCPYVRRAMRWAKQLKDEGYQVVIVGDESHPEVQAIYGATDERAFVVSTPQAIDELPSAKRIGLIAQTTQSIANYRACICAFIGRVEELKAFDTICAATEQRQSSAQELAAQVDVMVVIGGRNSANTKRLVEVCQESGAKTYHVETAVELSEEWFDGVNKAGVTAGASTPNWLIEGVLKRMAEFTEEKVLDGSENEGANEMESAPQVEEAGAPQKELEATPQEEVEAAPQKGEDTADAQMTDYDMMLPNQGDIIKGHVVQVGTDEVLVDIEYKSEGRIPLSELSFRPNVNPEEIVKVGDEITVKVLKVDDGEGNVILSKKRADAEQSWEKLEQMFADGETITAQVVQTVKGGLLVDVGVRGFIPASHVSRNFEDNLEKFIGQDLELKIIELDRQKNNVVFSHKDVLEQQYQQAKDKAFDNIHEGDRVAGVVRRLTDFGAFVDIGNGVEGLLHVSEMAYSRVSHPSDVLSENDKITVMILGVDKDKERISLGLKQTVADPWEDIADKYKAGDTVKGQVTRVVDFGAFVKLEDGVEGLIHISQLSHKHVAKAEDVVKPGDDVDVKVISVDPAAHRIGLSMRELEAKPEPRQAKPKGQPVVQETSNEELTTNLGDIFSGLGDLFKKDKE